MCVVVELIVRLRRHGFPSSGHNPISPESSEFSALHVGSIDSDKLIAFGILRVGNLLASSTMDCVCAKSEMISGMRACCRFTIWDTPHGLLCSTPCDSAVPATDNISVVGRVRVPTALPIPLNM